MAENIMQNTILLKRAQAAVLSRDFPTATRIFRGLLRNDPENTQLLNELGSLYVKSGEDERAIPLYKEVVRLEPKNVNALNSLGAIYRRLNRYNESIEVLTQALLVDENNSQIYYNLGFTYKLLGKNKEAIQCFSTVVDENPNDVLAFNHLGVIYTQTGEYEKAVSSFKRGLKIDPNHPILHLNLAKAYEKTGKIDETFLEYDFALRSKPGWLEAIDGYTELLLKNNSVKAAGDLIESCLRLNPKNVGMHEKMGRVYSKCGRYNDAESEYLKALETDPKNALSLSGLAYVYEKSDKLIESIRVMKILEDIDSENASMLKQFSHILLTAEKYNAASKKIKKVWDMNESDVQTLALLLQYYICRKDEGKTLGCFKKIESIDPGFMNHYLEAAKRYKQIGNVPKAEKYARKYTDNILDDSEGFAFLAMLFEEQEKLHEALENFKKAVEYDGNNVLYRQSVERVNGKLLIQAANAPETNPNEDFVENSEEEVPMGAKDEDFVPEEDIAPVLIEDEDEEKDDGFSFDELEDDEPHSKEMISPEMLDNASEMFDDGENSDDVSFEDLLPDDDPIEAAGNYKENSPFNTRRGASSYGTEEEMALEFEPENIDGTEPYPVYDDEDAVEDDAFGNVFDDYPEEQEAAGVEYENEADIEPVLDEEIDDEELDDEEEIFFDNLEEVPLEENEVYEDKSSEEEYEFEDETVEVESEPEDIPVEMQEEIPDDSLEDVSEEDVEDIPVEEELIDEGVVEESLEEIEELPETEEIEETEEVSETEVIPEEETEESDTVEYLDEDLPIDEGMDDVEDEKPIDFEEEGNESENTTDETETVEEVVEETTEESVPEEEAEIGDADIEEAEIENAEIENVEIENAEIEEAENIADTESIEEEPLEETEVTEETAETEDVTDNMENEEIFESVGDQELDVEQQNESIQESVFEPEISNHQIKSEEFARILDELKDRQMEEKYSPTVEMMKKLRSLSDYLPEDKKNEFTSSKAYLLIDYIIARLEGKPGLLATADLLRKGWVLEEKKKNEPESEKMLAGQVLAYMRSLIRELPDKDISTSLDGTVTKTLSKLS